MTAMMRFLIVIWLAISMRQCLGLPPAATPTPQPSPTPTPFPGVVVVLAPSAGPVDAEVEIHLMRIPAHHHQQPVGRAAAGYGSGDLAGEG